MYKKLYVGNLPFSTSAEDLNEIFSQVGQVASAKIVMDRESGRSKGFGFVEMASESEAKNAISEFNGAQLNGRPLTVNEARPVSSRPQTQGNPSDRGNSANRRSFGNSRGDRMHRN